MNVPTRMYELLFVSLRLHTWRRSEDLGLFLTDVMYAELVLTIFVINMLLTKLYNTIIIIIIIIIYLTRCYPKILGI
jgi:hypothetical protein